MTASAQYKLTRVFCGVYHYAEVSVTLDPDSETAHATSESAFAWLRDLYGPDAKEWAICSDYRVAAAAGATRAMMEAVTKGGSVLVDEIYAVVSDTTPSDVAFATYRATLVALGTDPLEALELEDWKWSGT